MTKAIEIKYGQDNVELINKAIMRGLPWNELTGTKVMQFFSELSITTKIADYRAIDKHFKIVGSPSGVPLEPLRLYEVALRRTRTKRVGVADDEVAFEAVMVESRNLDIEELGNVGYSVHEIGRDSCSAAIVKTLSLRLLQSTFTHEDCVCYIQHVFRFGQHLREAIYDWH